MGLIEENQVNIFNNFKENGKIHIIELDTLQKANVQNIVNSFIQHHTNPNSIISFLSPKTHFINFSQTITNLLNVDYNKHGLILIPFFLPDIPDPRLEVLGQGNPQFSMGLTVKFTHLQHLNSHSLSVLNNAYLHTTGIFTFLAGVIFNNTKITFFNNPQILVIKIDNSIEITNTKIIPHKNDIFYNSTMEQILS